jgi:predicted secreted protein
MAINEKRNIIAREINGFKDKEKEEERERKFNEEKDALTNSLYEALDGIHSQIPQEAKDVGMTTEMALKQYLPKLERKASKIEYWIERVEKSINMSELSFLKKQIGEESVE